MSLKKRMAIAVSAILPMAANAVISAFTVAGAPLDLQPQIDAAAERGGGVVRIPPGDHETKPFVLKSNITLEFAEGARILASTNLADYVETPAKQCFFIYAESATNISIVGKGVIDGRGSVFKEPKKLPSEMQPQHRPFLMRFSRCRDLRLEGFHYGNSGSWGLHLQNCDGVKVKGVTCFNHSNRNTDGIDIESANVTVEDCVLDTDDDAVCFKTESDKSFPVTNVVVRNCRIASCGVAVKFGTGSYNTFKDILVENCKLVRPKAATKYLGSWWKYKWAGRLYDVSAKRIAGINAIALEVVDGGRMENVTIRDIEMEGYLSPILVRHHHRHEPDGEVDTCLRNVLIENVRGSADGRLASSITGVPARNGKSARRPRNITLRNIHLTVPGGGTAEDAAERVPEADGAYPDSFMFGKIPLPAYGFYVRHADNIVFEDVEVKTVSPDARPPFVFDDATPSTLIHSHNDYAQKRPFWGAYEAGADSIEADVFLVDGELLVAHSRKELKKENTLRRLYLEPLREVMRKNGGRARPDGKPLQLVIDLKSGKPALDALLAIIGQEGFRGCFDIRKNPSAVKLSVGGDIAEIKDFLSYPDFVFFSVPSSRKIDDGQYKRVSWISDYARIYTKWRSGAMAECDKKKIRAAAARAHAKGVPYRLWGFPDHKEAWELTLELGLDYINTDHPAAAASFLRGDGVRVNH